MSEKCFCHLNGYAVKDATARQNIESLNTKTNTLTKDVSSLNITTEELEERTVRFYENIESIKNDNTLETGTCLITKGYYSSGDGGGAIYEIVEDELLVDNGGSIHQLNNGKFAKLLNTEEKINIKIFGAKGDGVTDDTTPIQNAIEYANNEGRALFIPLGTFIIKNKIDFKVSIYGVHQYQSIIKASSNFVSGYMVEFYDYMYFKTIDNICFDGSFVCSILGSSYQGSGSSIPLFNQVRFIQSAQGKYCIDFSSSIAVPGGVTGAKFQQCSFDGNNGVLHIGNNMDDIIFDSCRFGSILKTENSINGQYYFIGGHVNFINCYFVLPAEVYDDMGATAFFHIQNNSVKFDSCFIEELGQNNFNTIFYLSSPNAHLIIDNLKLNINSNNTNLRSLIFNVIQGASFNSNIKIDGITFTDYLGAGYKSTPIVKSYIATGEANLNGMTMNYIDVRGVNTFTIPATDGNQVGSYSVGYIQGWLNGNAYNGYYNTFGMRT